jgi:hypothetical protein
MDAQTKFIDKHRALATSLGVEGIDLLQRQFGLLSRAQKGASSIVCEGILNYALNHKIKKSAESLINQQLQFIAGELVDESFVQPVLLAAARATVG